MDRAITRATLELLADSGFDQLTIESVATRAGVARPTVYRRHASKAALVASALTGTLAAANPEPPDTGDVNEDVRQLLAHTVAALTDTPFGRAVVELVAPAVHDSELAAVLDAALEERRTVIRTLLERAEAQQRLRVADVEVGIDMLLGTVYFRHLITRQAIPLVAIGTAVDTVVTRPKR